MQRSRIRNLTVLMLAIASVLAACGRTPGRGPAQALVLNETSLDLEVGESQTLTAALTYKTGEPQQTEAKWSSSDATVATVSPAGVVTAVSEGSATITATHEATSLSAEAQVTVTAAEDDEGEAGDDEGDADEPEVTVTLTPAGLQLLVGESGKLTATVDGTDDKGVEWAVEPADQSIVELNASGSEATVTALSHGSVTVTVSSKAEPDAQATATITVAPLVIELDTGALELVRTQTTTVTAAVRAGEGADTGVTWSSGDAEVLALQADGNSVTVTAVGAGSTVLTATSDADPSISASIGVQVTLIGLELSADTLSVFPGQQVTLSGQLSNLFPGASDGLLWSVTPAGLLEADENGTWLSGQELTLTAADVPGEAILTVSSAQDPAVTETITLSVEEVPEFDSGYIHVGKSVTYADAPLGTEPNPFPTVSEALSHEDAGNSVADDATIVVAAGEYIERGMIELKGHQLQGAGAAETVLVPSDTLVGIQITGNEARVSDLTLDASALDEPVAGHPGVRGIYVSPDAVAAELENVAVIGVAVTDPVPAERGLTGIQLYGTTDATLRNVTVNNTIRNGIEVSGGSGITLENISVHNAGQGVTTVNAPEPMSGLGTLSNGYPITGPSGFGAIGIYGGEGSGAVDGLVLEGAFDLTGLSERAAVIIHPKEGVSQPNASFGVEIALGESFSLYAPDAFSPVILNTSEFNDFSQLEVSSGIEQFLDRFGVGFVAWLHNPPYGSGAGKDAELFIGFTAEQDAVEFGTAVLDLLERVTDDPLLIPFRLIELDLAATESGAGDTAGDVKAKNIIIVSSTSGELAGSIQTAVNFVSIDDRFSEGVKLAAGTYEQSVQLPAAAAGISITGAGSDEAGTILRGSGVRAGTGINLSAPEVQIRGLRLENWQHGIRLMHAEDAVLEDISISDARYGILAPNDYENLDGLNVRDVRITDSHDGLMILFSAANYNPASNILLQNLEISDIEFKGVYLESFHNSTINGLTMRNSGNVVTYQAGVGLEINLKYAEYGTISLENIDISASGRNLDGEDHVNSAALAVAVRDDGSYSSNHATLKELTLHDITISESATAIRFGEGSVADGDSLNEGAASTSLTAVQLEATDYLIKNYTTSEIDVSAPGNLLDGTETPVQSIPAELAGKLLDSNHHLGFDEMGDIKLSD